MICLKNRTFAVSQTTQKFFRKKLNGLWFAWKIVLLQYHKQPWKRYKNDCCGCDLLEKSYFCSITNNLLAIAHNAIQLWFAWKIVLLQYHKQQLFTDIGTSLCCDLLEKSYFCSITNNCTSLRYWYFELWFAWKIVLLQYHKQPSFQLVNYQLVVICLKNRTFAVSQTTLAMSIITRRKLWFAWKIVLLQYHKQRKFH